MHKFLISFCALLVSATIAHASCVGTKTFSTCYDADTGNSYSIQRYGGSTHMNGTNSRTGSNWSQDTHTYGGTSFQTGRDSRGNSWQNTCVNGQCF